MTPITDPTEDISGYFLIDTLNLPCSLDCDPLPINFCVPSDLTNISSLMPGLVSIDALNAGQLVTLREIMQLQHVGRHPWAVCAVITSDVGLEKLTKHISSLLSVTDGDGRPVLWRFFDPRVFSLVMAIYSDEQRIKLLGPIREWRFPWRGHWWCVIGEQYNPSQLNDLDTTFPTKSQWSLLKLSKLLDRVLLQVERDMALSTIGCLDVQTRALALLEEGSSEMHFSEPSELIDYAYSGVYYGSAFLSHRKFQHAKADLAIGVLNWWTFKESFDFSTLLPKRKDIY
jgi:hypothetical protein